ncbi:MAG: energy coupling factor transporter S component ThiW [Clostridia bacterium]|jgi:energy coupling factor transporter S component ThiW|nr:energy coupling factor transporter S component ThiW [Clostridia bacterium]
MKTKKLTISAMFVAIGVVAGNVIYIPVGASKCFPVQHTINVLSAVLLGPSYAVLNAFCISLLRNILQTGSLLAFPGSMIGAFIAGIVFKRTKNKYLCALGEVFGTGILGGLVAFPIALLVMGKKTGAFVYIIPFLLSTVGGSIIALIILKSSVVLKLGEKYNNRR